MLVTLLSTLLFLTFIVLGGFHFYWLFGGKWGLKQVIPTKEKTATVLGVPPLATLIVALGLTLFGSLYLLKSGLLNLSFSHWILTFAYWFIPSIFLLRAIGEFNYVGLFKKIKHTDFAKADSRIFVPLCLSIGLSGMAIQLLN